MRQPLVELTDTNRRRLPLLFQHASAFLKKFNYITGIHVCYFTGKFKEERLAEIELSVTVEPKLKWHKT